MKHKEQKAYKHNGMKHTRIYRAALLALTALATIACSNEITDTEVGNKTENGEVGKLITVTASQPTATESTGAPQTRMTYNEPNQQGSVVVNWATGDKFYVATELPQANTYTALTDAFKTFSLTGGAGSKCGTFTGEQPEGTTEGSTFYAFGGKKEQLNFINKEDGTKKAIRFNYEQQIQKGNNNKDHLSDYDFIIATADYTKGTSEFDFKHIGAMMKFTITLPQENMELSKLRLRASGLPFSSKMIWKTDESQTLESSDTTGEITLILETESYNYLQINDKVLTAYMIVAPTTELAGKPVILKIEDNRSNLYTAILNGAIIEAGKYYTVDAEVVNSHFNGEGTETSPYEINDAGELRKMAKLVNAGLLQNKHFKLTNDIDLGSEPWTPINGFRGTFSGENADGGNYTISNMKINGTHSVVNLGLFANLSFGKISHVTVSGEIDATVNRTEYNSFTEIGGIVGRISGNSNVEYCTSHCKINVTAGDDIESICAGGIVGFIINKGTLTNCTNSGSISLKKGAITTELYTGAIIGQIDEDDTVILNGYTNTGSPSSIIGFYNFSGTTGSLTISETVGDTPTIINSGSGAYPLQ